MRRAFGDVLMSIGAISIVLIVLIAFDGRLREQVADRVRQSQSPTELFDPGGQVRSVMRAVVQIVKAESQQHATLMFFVVAASILTVFMLRT